MGKEMRANPEETANLLSKLLSCWLIGFLRVAYKRDLKEDDLFEVAESEKSSTIGDKLEKKWNEEKNDSRLRGRKPNLWRTFLKTFWVEISLNIVLTILHTAICRVFQAFLVLKILEHFSKNSVDDPEDAYIYVGLLLLDVYVTAILHNRSKYLSRLYGLRMRVAFCALIYKKILKISSKSSEKSSAGYIVNLMSNDVQTLDMFLWFGTMVIIGPAIAIAAIFVLYFTMDELALISIAVIFIIAIPMNVALSKLVKTTRQKSAQNTDRRVKLMNEIISGIKVIKMYAWEEPFARLVHNVRQMETRNINKSLNYALIALMQFVTDRIPTFITLLIHALLNKTLGPNKIYMLALLTNYVNIYGSAVMVRSLTCIIETKVSINRIQEFLLQDERSDEGEVKENHNNSEPESMNFNDVILDNVTATWDSTLMKNTLQNVSLTVLKGQLCCIVGPVGSGKSSLLKVVLKELPVLSGHIELIGRVSYSSQDAWIFFGTVRENILFGRPYDRNRYQKVIEICALKRDLELFPQGDRTLVGERGVKLSGGQRARINLARAVYQDADVYIFDDPLSAVDTRVGSHLFDECITKYLKSKTRILVTHQVQHIQKSDLIVVLSEGKVKAQGTISDLRFAGINFSEFVAQREDESDNDFYDDSDICDHLPLTQRHSSSKRKGLGRRNSSKRSSRGSIVSSDINYEPIEELEVVVTGGSKWKVYQKYLRAGGNYCVLFIVFALFICSQIAINAVDYCLSIWADFEETHISHHIVSNNSSVAINNIPNDDSSLKTKILSIYGAVLLLCIFLLFIRIFAFTKLSICSSMALHSNMFENILHGTMRFFDTNPSGRILNRFSKDMGNIDQVFPKNVADSLQFSFFIIGVFVLTIITNYWLVIPVIIVLCITGVFVNTYIATASCVKRCEGIMCSPVYSHIAATMNGLETVRSFKAQDMMKEKFYKLQDRHSSSWFCMISVSYAFAIWLDTLMSINVTVLTITYVLLPTGINSAAAGLGISQSLSLLALLQYAVMQITEALNQLTCVERILEYTNIEQEENLHSNQDEVSNEKWPEHGVIEFSNFYLKYTRDDPPVLKNLNIIIESQEKIGIVGRTGAGKSSLIVALFRLAHSEGSIVIDGIDISKIALKHFRKKLSIIPQEPVLFSASLRYNLDPFEEYSDGVLNEVLEEVELKDTVNGLDFKVTEGGSNLSVGQRQLVCLARAILRKNKILVLDEATANVDHQTDALIQDTIRRKFKTCTVLTIAHRLNTIMDSNRVLVMDGGTVVEYDHPYTLLQNRNGHFFKMVEETGISNMLHLSQIAKRAFSMQCGDLVEEINERERL